MFNLELLGCIALPPYGPRVAQSPSEINESHHHERAENLETIICIKQEIAEQKTNIKILFFYIQKMCGDTIWLEELKNWKREWEA